MYIDFKTIYLNYVYSPFDLFLYQTIDCHLLYCYMTHERELSTAVGNAFQQWDSHVSIKPDPTQLSIFKIVSLALKPLTLVSFPLVEVQLKLVWCEVLILYLSLPQTLCI